MVLEGQSTWNLVPEAKLPSTSLQHNTSCGRAGKTNNQHTDHHGGDAVLDVREAVRSLWAVPKSTRAVQSLYRFLTSSVAALLQVRPWPRVQKRSWNAMVLRLDSEGRILHLCTRSAD